MTVTNSLRAGWIIEDLPEKLERHQLPTPDNQLSKHVVSKLCFCHPTKEIYDVTFYSHRNITRAEASNEAIFKKRLKKAVAERIEKEILIELSALKS
jgi:hypothetical protein